MSAKITRPSLSGVVQRKRLFRLLDVKMTKPVVWVSAPAGSGKTTLVASYLDAREIPCIWYHCDEGDSDLATFFYYMRLAAKKAAPRRKNFLPLLTPEYLDGIPAFTRRYFEKLFGILTSRYLSRKTSPSSPEAWKFAVVLDDYQEVPAGSSFHSMIADGFDLVLPGIHIVTLSRCEPPPELARLRANGGITFLEYGDVRFTFDESRELAHGRVPELDDASIRSMHEKAEGWAAGIILMLERSRVEGVDLSFAEDRADERVFDYFAGEFFDRVEEVVQGFLLKTAFLPVLAVSPASKLSGVDAAGPILSELNRNHFFTERLSGNEREYQYHPLFRSFLLNRAKTAFSAHELAAIRKEAALLLEEDGRIEDAARLYGEGGDGGGLARLVIRHARKFLAQGRNKVVEEWLTGISGVSVGDVPWIRYWSGMCLFPADMPRARYHLEKALACFRARDDAEGAYLSWSGIVDTYAFDLDDWKRLEDGITVFHDMRRALPAFPSKEIEFVAASRMLVILVLIKTDQPNLVNRWLRRVSALLRENPSFDSQMDTLFIMSLYHLWQGDYARNDVLLERAEAEVRHRMFSPFVSIRVHLMRGIHYWVTAEYDRAVNTLSEGLRIAEKSGVRVFDSLLWGFRAAAEMAPGRPDRAEDSLKNQMTSLLDRKKTLDLFFYHVNSAWCALLRGNPFLAAEHLGSVSEQTERMGTPYYRALWNIGMAQAAFLGGRAREAKSRLRAARRIGLAMESHVLEWYTLLIEAWFFLREGKETRGLALLRRGLSLGRMHGYANLEFHQPPVMRFLYARALEEEMEPDYVKGLIRKQGLTPPLVHESGRPTPYLHGWPYPVRIYTLGRFEILRDDGPFPFSGKEQKKPLELLKALIAFGGRDVPVHRLTDALWPDAEGDLARKSFETTLGRLRRLLGCDEFIVQRSRQLSLNPLYCWADILALEQLMETARETKGDPPDLLYGKAVKLYKGPFLPADSEWEWALGRGEALKNRLLSVIRAAGRRCEQAGDWEKAAEYYEKGIEIDGLAEELYRRLMVCQLNLGNNSDAVAVYNRCSRMIHSELGVEPSDETRAILTSIPQKK